MKEMSQEVSREVLKQMKIRGQGKGLSEKEMEGKLKPLTGTYGKRSEADNEYIQTIADFALWSMQEAKNNTDHDEDLSNTLYESVASISSNAIYYDELSKFRRDIKELIRSSTDEDDLDVAINDSVISLLKIGNVCFCEGSDSVILNKEQQKWYDESQGCSIEEEVSSNQ
jgi:hypothetical protein